MYHCDYWCLYVFITKCQRHYVLPITTSLIWFPLNNLSSYEANALKFIHMVKDDNERPSSFFGFYHFFYSRVMPLDMLEQYLFTLARSRGIHVLWTHSFIFILICDIYIPVCVFLHIMQDVFAFCAVHIYSDTLLQTMARVKQ